MYPGWSLDSPHVLLGFTPLATIDPPRFRHVQPVGIIGSGKAAASSQPYEVARKIARALAERGLAILCGGRGGVMEAACLGAREAGGLAIGLLPGGDLSEGNAFAGLLLPSGLGTAQSPLVSGPERVSRNRVIASASHCLVAVAGGVGTRDEIDHALSFGKTVFGICGAPLPDGAEPGSLYEPEAWPAVVDAVVAETGRAFRRPACPPMRA